MPARYIVFIAWDRLGWAEVVKETDHTFRLGKDKYDCVYQVMEKRRVLAVYPDRTEMLAAVARYQQVREEHEPYVSSARAAMKEVIETRAKALRAVLGMPADSDMPPIGNY